MPELNSVIHSDPRKMRDPYVQLGLDAGATMREIETAYWQFARELKGQAAMTPYTAAYEALVNRVKPQANDARPAPATLPEIPRKHITVIASPSKLGWPAN